MKFFVFCFGCRIDYLRLDPTKSQIPFCIVGIGGQSLSTKVIDSNRCYVLDCGDEVFVWVGRTSSESDRGASVEFAEHLIILQGRSPGITVDIEEEGEETVLFKEKFLDWMDGMNLELRSAGN